jgi:anhydro-N-acetylmuramic acid kinase
VETKKKYKVIGLMSGTSMDGVDVACCIFRLKGNQWTFRIQKAITVPYTNAWRQKLLGAPEMKGEDLLRLHSNYGEYLGNLCAKFIRLYDIRKVDFVASHGHTVFHQPANNFTFQLGDGRAVYASAALPVVYDFRSLDVALGGEGAPLVPVGDHYLFAEYDVCLNLGGIANLSRIENGRRIAFDICVANMGLNHLASKAGMTYDKHGLMASDGTLNHAMLSQLTKVYSGLKSKRPSLGREFFEKKLLPVLDQENIPLEDRLHTLTESIASEIALTVKSPKRKTTVLCTGGGAFNPYLIYRLVEQCGDQVQLILPDQETIKFKEALIFAFLGVRRVRNEINCLKTVTGASRDSSAGELVGM